MAIVTCMCCAGGPVEVGAISVRGRLALCGRCYVEHERRLLELPRRARQWTPATLEPCDRAELEPEAVR